MVGVQGYLVSPTATYHDVAQSRIADTRDGTGGIPATPVPAGGSVTFTATGVDGIPAAGVPAVARILRAG
jgi:hypothetical protein